MNIMALFSKNARAEADLEQAASYLAEHKGGEATLLPDAYGPKADHYYEVWSKMLANNELKDLTSYRAHLHRTPTGLELHVR